MPELVVVMVAPVVDVVVPDIFVPVEVPVEVVPAPPVDESVPLSRQAIKSIEAANGGRARRTKRFMKTSKRTEVRTSP